MQSFPIRWQSWKARKSRPVATDPPLRADLFSAEQLARHARAIAQQHQTTTEHPSNKLLARLAENERIIREFTRATRAENQHRRVISAAEWLLDNYYLLEEQIQMAKRHLPRGYNRELPRLLNGPSAGLPRVYDIVLELVAHVDAQIDEDQLHSFVAAYQEISPLKLGELWAVPIMLRLGLIENLQRVISRLRIARADRECANMWVGRLRDMAENNPARLVVVVANMAQSEIAFSSAFVAEFCQLLTRHGHDLHLARSWVEQRLQEQGSSIERMIDLESQSQAADQVSVSHSIASLRFLSAMDWKRFVENLSLVDAALRADPAGCYPRMDFATRDRYRHEVESMARHGSLSEVEVAQQAIQLAGNAARDRGGHDRSAHVGFYLIDGGRRVLEDLADTRWPWLVGLEHLLRRFPLAFYAGGIAVLTLLVTWGFIRQAVMVEGAGWILLPLTASFVFCASQLAMALINWLSALLVTPKPLPRLDYSSGIPPDGRTMVVVPTMLASPEGVDHLLETLEIHYLANRDECLHFALLTDFRDAPREEMPEDRELLGRARDGIAMLNRKYDSAGGNLFFLFHRPRRWNAAEGKWMGCERKRGKLTEFNHLLRGGSGDCFCEIVGQTAILPAIRYVITLDTDTQLPRDTARRLVATMDHPLNRPVFDAARAIVTEGYGILQPRVGVSLPGARRSWFVRMFAGDAGIDPYTRAVSDVYQDLFGEGSFIGKGIYDVDAFLRAMGGRIPLNTVLSHDLLEACHARSALVSDLELYEEYPFRYNVDMDRRHRWMRGDWQITPWLLPRVPGSDVRRIANPLSGLSLWKIFDNLRRSLVPPAMLLFLLGAWLLAPRLDGLATWGVMVIITLPGLLSTSVNLLRKAPSMPWSMHVRDLARVGCRQLSQVALTLVMLPYDAFISADAIARTLWRLLVSRKRLLEWQTSHEAAQACHTRLAGYYGTMWIAPAIALAAGVALAITHRAGLPLALPILAAWFAAPCVAWWISQPIESPAPTLTGAQTEFLRTTARKTWCFFQSMVTAVENWLPPDNFQEIPTPLVASRTSPTNMGLALLANLSARDFGYLPVGGLIERTRNALATMQRLERYRGHFYNWYETRTLDILQPPYISSVDSGNLAGHLLTLAAGLREEADAPVFTTGVFEGLRDTVRILIEFDHHSAALARLDSELAAAPAALRAAHAALEKTRDLAASITAGLTGEKSEFMGWAESLLEQAAAQADDLRVLAPWLASPTLAAPATAALESLLAQLDQPHTLREVAQWTQTFGPAVDAAISALPAHGGPSVLTERALLTELAECVRAAAGHAGRRLRSLEALARQCDELAMMDFTFLFDPARDLFSIGFNVAERRLDNSFYDLLASEARLCSYVAIALGQVPQDHWFSMGRLLAAMRGAPILVSWSGSMFEYLMPLLVMPGYENTLLDHTCKGAVRQQIRYGKSRGVPWGISESGFNRIDVQFNYQYRAFGVPGLGLKRGLGEDLVIAPYATMMALMVAPVAACENLRRMAADGRVGSYGFYEAVDYTPARQPPDKTSVTIRSYMAHHQGMSLVALDNLLCDNPMPRRFMSCPMLKAADLLLQERVPRTVSSMPAADLVPEVSLLADGESETVMRVFTNPTTPVPEVHLLSNGRYHVAITSAGGGYSRWHELALTRWREDATCDHWGIFIYVRDLATGEFFSTAYQPTVNATDGYEAIFTQARAEFRQRQAGLEVHTEICVSPEDDVELRRVTIINRTPRARLIELTSYAEIVLTHPADDEAHPAFGNLFVETDFVSASAAVLGTRRARSEDESPPCMMHLMVAPDADAGAVSCETDRGRFVGRGGSMAHPAAMRGRAPLSNTVGPVLDPIVSLRRTITLQAHTTATVDLVFGVAANREAVLAYVEKYQSQRMVDRALEMAWTHSQVTLHHLNATEAEGRLYDRLAGALIYADPSRRSNSGVLLNNRRGQAGLWRHGISGDVPIVLLHVSDLANIDLVRQLVRAHSYWRMKGLTADLVILYEDPSVYRQGLQEQIGSLVAIGMEGQNPDRPGGIFVRRMEQLTGDDRLLLQAMARVVLDDEGGNLEQQLEHRRYPGPRVPPLTPTRPVSPDTPAPLPPRELIYSNGLGGFTRDGHEYVITLEPGRMTPAPWVNVLANSEFGTLISENGAAYTWMENAHEFRLTPWSNDPVRDPTGEAIYIRDEHTGQYWSPTPTPVRGTAPYVIRHGFGYTVFEHTSNGIAAELWVYVAMDAPVKFSVLKLRNVSGRPRRLSVTAYHEWVLGDLRHKNLLHVRTEVEAKTGALLARNHANPGFPEHIAFVDMHDATRTLTGDRKEFIGRNGNLSQPAAMKRAGLSGKVGAGLDPCGAMQVVFDLADAQERETTVRLGVGRNLSDVQQLVQRFRRADSCRGALEGVWLYWGRTLGAINVDTPDPAVNVMANGWLLYQTLGCRLWGRTGFYQSGGAYGFRDQLQDVMALVHAEPGLTREHL